MWLPDFPAIGFFISYIATSLLVLEVLRLISTDANKREAERFLDRYIGASKAAPSPSPSSPSQQDPRASPESSSRTAATFNPAQAPVAAEQTTAFTIEDLDEMALSRRRRQHRPRTPSPTPRTLASPAPVRQPRTRSNTLTSTSTATTASSSSSRHSITSRHSSPSSSSSRRSSTSRHSKTSPERASSRTKSRADESVRRHGSPGFRRSREAQGLGGALQRLVRGKA